MKIGGKERPIKFGLNQSVLYCELRDININQMNEEFEAFGTGKYNGSEVRDLVWSALKDGARFKKIKFNEDNLTVGDWIEDLSQGELDDFIKELLETLPKPKASIKKKKAK